MQNCVSNNCSLSLFEFDPLTSPNITMPQIVQQCTTIE